jgi:hypothetical protein
MKLRNILVGCVRSVDAEYRLAVTQNLDELSQSCRGFESSDSAQLRGSTHVFYTQQLSPLKDRQAVGCCRHKM